MFHCSFLCQHIDGAKVLKCCVYTSTSGCNNNLPRQMYHLINTSDLELEMCLQSVPQRLPFGVSSSRNTGGSSVLPRQYLFQHPPVWISCEPNPWPFPLSLSLAPALTLPSTLLGTRWPVNFASPLRPGYRPCALTSREKRTQDGKLPLIASHAWGVYCIVERADTSQWSQFRSLSCCALSYFLWNVSLIEHFASLDWPQWKDDSIPNFLT